MNQVIRNLFVQHDYTMYSRKYRRCSICCDLVEAVRCVWGKKRKTGGAPSLFFYNTFAPELEGRCIGKAEDFVSPHQKES